MEERTESWIMGMSAAALMSFMGTKTPWSHPILISMVFLTLSFSSLNERHTAFLIHLWLKARTSQSFRNELRD